MKVYTDCRLCSGKGKLEAPTDFGFFHYDPGVACPECRMRHQRELAGAHAPTFVVQRQTDDVEARLRRLEEAVFGHKQS